MSEPILTREDTLLAARNVARQLGYAIAVHGSQARDLDLLAVPWVPEAESAEELVESIAAAVDGIYSSVEEKPHGRRGWSIVSRHRLGIDAWYIDLSVMPRSAA